MESCRFLKQRQRGIVLRLRQFLSQSLERVAVRIQFQISKPNAETQPGLKSFTSLVIAAIDFGKLFEVLRRIAQQLE